MAPRMTPNQYSIEASRNGARAFTIRGLKPTNEPHAACPTCYGDATSVDTGDLLEFRCDRGHQFHQTRTSAMAHAKFLAHYHAGQDGYHK